MLPGGLARFCQGDTVDVKIMAGEIVLGKDALADLTGLIDGTLRQENRNFTEFRIWALTY